MSAFARDEAGATAIEYAIIAGMIALVIIPAVTLLGPLLEGVFEDVAAGFGEEGGETG